MFVFCFFYITHSSFQFDTDIFILKISSIVQKFQVTMVVIQFQAETDIWGNKEYFFSLTCFSVCPR